MSGDRRSGQQRRNYARFFSFNKSKVGRRLDDLEFAVFLKMAVITVLSLFACILVLSLFL